MLDKFEFDFLNSFPFEEYEITSGKELELPDGEINEYKNDLYNFTYSIPQSEVTISFHEDDMRFLNEKSNDIQELDSFRKNIDVGLKSNDIKFKFKCIKKNRKFLKRIGSPATKLDTFNDVLNGIQEMNGAKLSDKLIKKIINLNEKMDLSELTIGEEKSIFSYLNFQLHHVKIMLGVIIASKIH